MTHPEQLAQRFRKQAVAGVTPERLCLTEAIDMMRAYMLALEILERESGNENRPSR